VPGLSFALLTFSAVFFVVDPFAAIPLFLVITQGDSPEKRRKAALKAAVVTTITLLAFAATGGLIFRLFGITLGAFKIAGGILLFLVALDMMRAQRSPTRSVPEEEREGIVKEDVAVIPLAIPVLAGPGAIATVTVLMSDAWKTPGRAAIVVACILLTGLLTFLLLRAATRLERALKQTGLNILNRLMGLLLAAVAVQFVVNGVLDSFPTLRAAG
jgi:multiple antibiotic resistance protein